MSTLLAAAMSGSDASMTVDHSGEAQEPPFLVVIGTEPIVVGAVDSVTNVWSDLRRAAAGAGVVFAQDDFENRTTAPGDGIGNAQVGGTWVVQAGAVHDPHVIDGALFFEDNDDPDVEALLPGAIARDTELLARFQMVPTPDVIGGRVSFYLRNTTVGSGPRTHYQVQIDYDSGLVITCTLRKFTAGTGATVQAAATIAGLGWGDVIACRMQVVGTTAPTLRARLWKDGDPEPTTWHREASDGSPAAELQGPGYVGVKARAETAVDGVDVRGFRMTEFVGLSLPEAAASHAIGDVVVVFPNPIYSDPIRSPMLAPGDLLYLGPDGQLRRLPMGSEGQTLKVLNGRPQWVT